MDHPPPSTISDQPESKPELKPETESSEYAPYPKLDPNDVVPPPDPLLTQPPTTTGLTTVPPESNPYVSVSPSATSSSSSSSNTNYAVDTMKDVLEKWGKKAAEVTTKAQDFAGNMWQHLKTNPNFADAAVARISQQTKVLAEGGYENVFKKIFETLPEEQLQKWYACYLSTSAGPVMGTLYLSTAKLAFCSDNPLSYQVGEQTEWSYYKMILPLHQLKAVNPSTSKINAAEKYIQIISVDSHEFWFMGFVHYDSAVKNLQQVLQTQTS
ncbi:hypothetical protein RND81_01G220800 [Saponaria officinalis]|uniref:GRAM domain-containing protein n=1 Tax=Saponaria officinalis TaxID=3572 RepID=A0AAW1NGI0_SAPOF